MSTTAPHPPPSAAQLRRARGHLRAAFAVLQSPSADAEHAVVHLLRVWLAIAPNGWGATTAPAEPFKTPGDLPEAIADGRLGNLPPSRCAVAASLVRHMIGAEGSASRAAPSRRRLLAHSRLLARMLRQLEQPQQSLARPSRRLVAGLVFLLLVSLAIAWWWRDATREPWHAAYFPTQDFQGKPIVRHDRLVSFQWGEEAPMATLPRHRFSARWQTCLTLEKRTPVAFQLTSDGHSKLYVDGTAILDNPGLSEARSRGLRLDLAQGTHHLQVEFVDDVGVAGITLSASLDGQSPQPLTTLSTTSGVSLAAPTLESDHPTACVLQQE